MASKATVKARQHLRDACSDELTNLISQKDVFFDQWALIIKQIETLDQEYDFQAIKKLNEMMQGINQGSKEDIGEAYRDLRDALGELEVVLQYDNFPFF